jgi:hypothetical protein
MLVIIRSVTFNYSTLGCMCILYFSSIQGWIHFSGLEFHYVYWCKQTWLHSAEVYGPLFQTPFSSCRLTLRFCFRTTENAHIAQEVISPWCTLSCSSSSWFYNSSFCIGNCWPLGPCSIYLWLSSVQCLIS